MAGKCVLCNNLEGKKLIIDDEEFNGCRCIKGKFDKNGVDGFYSTKAILKPIKTVQEIEDDCADWDDRLKAKKVE